MNSDFVFSRYERKLRKAALRFEAKLAIIIAYVFDTTGGFGAAARSLQYPVNICW